MYDEKEGQGEAGTKMRKARDGEESIVQGDALWA